MYLGAEQQQKRLDFKGGLFSHVKCGRSSTYLVEQAYLVAKIIKLPI